MTDTTVATTIWQQLGGNRFDRMVGVKKKAARGAISGSRHAGKAPVSLTAR